MKKIEISKGTKFYRLTYIEDVINQKVKGRHCLFQCECGNKKVIWLPDVKRGNAKSCGCYKIETVIRQSTTHGLSKTNTYSTWEGIIQRMTNENKSGSKDYLKRIDIDPRWFKFENFLNDMGIKPDGKTIDRIDNNAGYWKDNCRWTNNHIQSRNKRSNVKYKGEYAVDVSIRLGGNPSLISHRIQNGWSLEKAFNTPIKDKQST